MAWIKWNDQAVRQPMVCSHSWGTVQQCMMDEISKLFQHPRLPPGQGITLIIIIELEVEVASAKFGEGKYHV